MFSCPRAGAGTLRGEFVRAGDHHEDVCARDGVRGLAAFFRDLRFDDEAPRPA